MQEHGNMNENTQAPVLLLTPRQTARALGISERTLATRTKEGVFPIVKIGRCTRYDAEFLRRWIAEHSQTKKGETPQNCLLTNRK
jgi:predicted DNA-binding transcriptional regulator AlpA